MITGQDLFCIVRMRVTLCTFIQASFEWQSINNPQQQWWNRIAVQVNDLLEP